MYDFLVACATPSEWFAYHTIAAAAFADGVSYMNIEYMFISVDLWCARK